MTPHQDQMARRLCQLLDSAADDLSPRIQSRLAAARGQALVELLTRTVRAGALPLVARLLLACTVRHGFLLAAPVVGAA